MKGDHMGTDPAHPSPRELPLSNQTRFRSGAGFPMLEARGPGRSVSSDQRNEALGGVGTFGQRRLCYAIRTREPQGRAFDRFRSATKRAPRSIVPQDETGRRDGLSHSIKLTELRSGRRLLARRMLVHGERVALGERGQVIIATDYV